MPDAQSNVMTVDSAGNVGADFSGHVSAQGLDLNAEPFVSGATVPKNSVNWIRRSDGAYVAEITASDNGDMRYDTSGIAGTAEHLMRAADASGNMMGLEVGTDHISTWASASTTPGGFVGRTLVNAAGATDFVRSRSPQNTMVLYGLCAAAGGVSNASGINNTRQATGQYAITWPGVVFNPVPTVQICPTAAERFWAITTITTTSVGVVFATVLNGAGVDSTFTILIVGNVSSPL